MFTVSLILGGLGAGMASGELGDGNRPIGIFCLIGAAGCLIQALLG